LLLKSKHIIERNNLSTHARKTVNYMKTVEITELASERLHLTYHCIAVQGQF